ncbi:MAG TPA: hypothetical protein VH024_17485 [Candidatus Angelobacter sp.]|jgi:hypothetical protein|nr:hypothetical protein [Candidatus Angelobacter sp.]
MTINYSYQLRTNKVAQTQLTIGGSGVMKIFSGVEPSNCAAADPAGLLCSINLPATFMQSSGGIGTLVGRWTGVGIAVGSAASFRIYDGSGICHIQGNVVTDLVMASTAITVGLPVTVTGFSVTAPGEGTPIIPTTATLAETEASDTLAQPVRGSLMATEVSDTMGGRPVTGTLARTEAADVVSAQGGIPSGTLAKSSVNIRYLSLNGNCVLACGSHTWDAFQVEAPATLTYQQWIDNIIVPEINPGPNAVGLERIWFWHTSHSDGTLVDSQVPFIRTGPGTAHDGGPKWDLTKYNEALFTQLLNLVNYAAPKNIHCQIEFFQISSIDPDSVYNDENNINGTGVTGDGEADGSSTICTNLEKAFVTHVVTKLYNSPNVTYELNNETHETAASLSWLNTILGTVHAVETSLGGIRHLVCCGAGSAYDGSSWGGLNPTFRITGTDYCQPGWGDSSPYDQQGNFGDIPLGGMNGNQTVILDTDHGLLGSSNTDSVWRALTRGWGGYLHMDVGGGNSVTEPAQAPLYQFLPSDVPTRLGILGVTTAVNLISSLNGMQPADAICSTSFCLADNTHLQYIAYQPNGGSSFTLNLSAAAGNTLAVTWIDAGTGLKIGSTTNYVATSSTAQSFLPLPNSGSVGIVLSRTVAAPSIVVANPGSQVVNVQFNIQAAINGYSSVPLLQYSFNNVAWNSLPSGSSVTSTHATIPLTLTTINTYTVYVRDTNAITVKGNTGAFSVGNVVTATGTPSLGWGAMYMGAGGAYPLPSQITTTAGTHRTANINGIGGASFNGPPSNYNVYDPTVAASTNMSYSVHLLTTADSRGGPTTPALWVSGSIDYYVTNWIDSMAAQGFTVQNGYTGKLFIRIIWEQNYPGTCPGNYCSQNANGSQVGGYAYWFNTGRNSAIGGSPSLATANSGNFWAWQHIYNLMSYNVPTSYARQKGVPCYIVWNPTVINSGVTEFNVPPAEIICNYPAYMYPGDQYCDIHAIDIYTNNFYLTDATGPDVFYTYPGYASQPAFTRNWPRGAAQPLDQWAFSADNTWHAFDFYDASGSLQDGLPTNGQADPTGVNSNWGWSVSKAVDFASATGTFAGAIDPVSGQARKVKPLCVCECGAINTGNYGCDFGGGHGPLDDPSGAQPAFMGGTGGTTDTTFWQYVNSRFAAAQAKGVDVVYFIPWSCATGTIQTQRMWTTFGQAFPGL